MSSSPKPPFESCERRPGYRQAKHDKNLNILVAEKIL